MFDVNNVASAMYQSLRHEKACRQFAILAWRSHDDGDAAAFHSDFQWLLGGQEVLVLGLHGAFHPPHHNFSHWPGKQG
jgi:hypothetical protein